MATWTPIIDFEGNYYGKFDLHKACIVRERMDDNGYGYLSKRATYIQDLVISKTGRPMIHFHSLHDMEKGIYCPVTTEFAAKWLDKQGIDLDQTELYPFMKNHLRSILAAEGY
jgi:hypothetical protein